MSSKADWDAVPGGVRWSLGAALLAAAAAHLPVIPMHLREAPYLGWSFVAFVLAATVVAGGVVLSGSRRWLLVAATLCAAAIAAYCATRLVAFPQLADDVGNWAEPAGVAALLGELAAPPDRPRTRAVGRTPSWRPRTRSPGSWSFSAAQRP